MVTNIDACALRQMKARKQRAPPWRRVFTWVELRGGVATLSRRNSGGIAQLVERFVRNEEARGSNPLTSTSARTEWLQRVIECTRTDHHAYLNSQRGRQRTLSRLASRLVPFSAFSFMSGCRSGALTPRRGGAHPPAKPWRRLPQPP